MHKGNIVRINIDRTKYRLTPTAHDFANILIGSVIKVHKQSVSVKAMDINATKHIVYLTIDKSEVVAIL